MIRLARYRGRSKLSQEQRAAIIKRFGLDGSKWDQFMQYIERTLRGDFGRSFDSTKPVVHEILDRLPNTLLLVGISTVLDDRHRDLDGHPSRLAARWPIRSRLQPRSSMALVRHARVLPWACCSSPSSAPSSGWFPTGGVLDPAGHYSGFSAVVDRARHLVLPVATLTLGYLGSYSLVMRTSMLDTLREDYLTTARAKGLRDRDVMRRHAVPNALLPSVSLIAIGFGFIIGGAITTETVFSYPGLGLATYRGHRQHRPADDAGAVHVLQHRGDRVQHLRRCRADVSRPANPSGRMSSATWTRRKQSARRVWRQLRSDRAAMVGLALLALFVAMALLAPLFADRSELQAVAGRNNPNLAAPSGKFWLGTDEIGRDVFALVLWGARVSLYIGLLATVVAVVIGSVLGLIAGYAKGWISRLMLAIDDFFLVLPFIPLAIVLALLLGRSPTIMALGHRRHVLGRAGRA